MSPWSFNPMPRLFRFFFRSFAPPPPLSKKKNETHKQRKGRGCFFSKINTGKRRRRRKRGRGFSLSLTKRKEKKKEKITLPARQQPTQPCLPSSLPRRSSSPTRSRSPIPRGPRRPCAPPSTWPGRSGRARGRRPWPLRGRLFFLGFFFSRGRGREGRKVRWSFW